MTMTFTQSNNDANTSRSFDSADFFAEIQAELAQKRSASFFALLQEELEQMGSIHDYTMQQIETLLPPSLKLRRDDTFTDEFLYLGLLQTLRACNGEFDFDTLPEYYQSLLKRVDGEQHVEYDDDDDD